MWLRYVEIRPGRLLFLCLAAAIFGAMVIPTIIWAFKGPS